MNKIESATIAFRIVDRLFRNGQNHEADRLVLELHGKRDGGGWCKRAIADIIEQELQTR